MALSLGVFGRVTPLMAMIERIVVRLAGCGGAMPNSPVLGELAGNRGRPSAMRALVRLEKIGRLRVEVDMANRRRRAILPDGRTTGWGEARPGHSPFCRGALPRTKALQPKLAVVVTLQSAPSPAPAASPRVSPASCCQWPMWGDHERATNLYCGAVSIPGRSWCQDHLTVVFHANHMTALPPVEK